MTRTWTAPLRKGGLTAVLAVALVTSACQLCIVAPDCSDGGCGANAKVCKNPTVRALAVDLDDLESHIEKYGSVVAEQPSVWGQARLTHHREEFEKTMAAMLSQFHVSLQGTLSRSDQAYVADAMSLSFTAAAAASKSPSPGPLGQMGCLVGAPGAASSSSSSSSSSSPDASGGAGGSSKSGGAGASPDLSSTFGAFDSGNFTRNPARLPAAVGFANIAQGGVSLEPTVMLDQMKRYLDHLHELRRMNEGDDTADSPGYSLNLVRIPVSVLPGAQTTCGHGAEITMTLTPHLHDELLPMTFRNLVTNDLLDEICVPLTPLINDQDVEAYLQYLLDTSTSSKPGELGPPTPLDKSTVLAQAPKPAPKDGPQSQSVQAQKLFDKATQKPKTMQLLKSVQATPSTDPHQVATNYGNALLKQRISVAIPATKLRQARRPFPPSQIPDIYGWDESVQVALAAYKVFEHDLPNTDITHYHDVQGYFQEEINGAYKYLNDPPNVDLWHFCDQLLVSAIRGRHVADIEQIRGAFEREFNRRTGGLDPKKAVTATLAWGIIVDSALLTDQLVQDMKEAASARGGFHLPTEWMPYFLPCPPPEARQAFNEYVQVRWPIHVFALDPETDQQNIADTYSSRREMQLAISLAFVSGQVSGSNLLRYARRLETEMETIALNNTGVGFSHGTDTFGWRFYPRYQTPDTEGNATVFFRDLLIGGPNRDALLRQRRLEPGIRECVAIVLMPSFVPYADLDASSNWFSLVNPRCKVMDSTDAIKLSAKIKSIHNCEHNVGNADCYRDGDLERLFRRAQQLETRLPLQTMSVQVPYENTLGGFAMFNSGATDLAPELLGWYGSPAINLDAPTTIFLIGNHFSVLQTQVIAGGQAVTQQQMLSRQVMQVVIPAGALALVEDTGRTYGCDKPMAAQQPGMQPAQPGQKMKPEPGGDMTAVALYDNPPIAADGPAATPVKQPEAPEAPRLFVDVQLATPYGVTSHLLIPACKLGKSGSGGGGQDSSGAGGDATAAAPSVLPAWTTTNLALAYVYKGLGIAPSDQPTYQPKELKINFGPHILLQPTNVVTLKSALSSGAKTKLQDMNVTITATNYDATTHVLTLSESDVNTLASRLFAELQYQFGPEATKPPTAVTLTTSVTGPGLAATTLNNQLKVSWIKGAAAAKPTATAATP